MKKAATASIMAVLAVMALAACNRGEPAPARVEVPAEPWVQKEVVLYLPDRILKQRTEVSDLAPYLRGAGAAAAAAAKTQPMQPGASGMLLLMVKPGGRSKAWIVTGEPALKPEVADAAIRRVEAVPAPTVREGPILIGLEFDAWGGGAAPASGWPPIPRDWYAHFPKDGGALDDALLAKVWPE
ncbi:MULTISPECIES: hypothetical protein [unclassified Brevundimonas]|uniref:hypothetical protein n=1 Tax=unclassified Brevundimonas TaxID=2622653 RepID=UPI003F911194